MSSLDKKLKIYLAGSMSACDSFEEMNEWRVAMTVELLKRADIHDYVLNVLNPVSLFNFEEVKYESQREVKEYDLAHVLSSDIVIVDLNKIEQSPGTIIELQKAKDNYIPVLSIGKADVYSNLHPWINDCITHNFEAGTELADYISYFYLI